MVRLPAGYHIDIEELNRDLKHAFVTGGREGIVAAIEKAHG